MRSFAVLVVSALLFAACAAGRPAPGSAAPTSHPTATGSRPSATPRPSPTPVPVAGCPTDAVLSVRQYVDADPACFGGDDVTIRAWLDFSPPMGFEGPGIEPAWLAFPPRSLSALWQAPPPGPENLCSSDRDPDCAWFFAHVDPRSSLEGAMQEKRWIVVTGHVQDPAAGTCHYVPLEGSTEELPPDAEAVAHCRAQFVLTSLTDAP